SGGRIERIDTPGSGAGAKRVLGLSHRDLEARLGAYHPDYIGGRAFAARVHSATLAVLAARTEGGSWEQVHGIMADHGLRYERYGGGARISDEKSNATMKAADADRRLRKGEMEKCFGRMIDGERTELLRAAREAARIAQEIVTAERMKNDPSDLLRGLVAHDSTFARDDVERAVATRIVNVGARDAIVEAALRHCVVLGSDDAYETRYSLPEVVRDERALRDAAELMATRGSGPRIERTASEHLDAQQRHAYDYATSGRDLSLITGVPGAGKTTLVRDIAAAYREAGYTVRAVAVANAACDVLLRETDLPARNVAKELYEWGEGRAQLTNRDVLIIDEVSMLGSDQGARLLDAAARAGAKVIALGDDRQLAAVGRGDTLRAMADALGEQRVDLQTTRRQQIAWQREATHAMRAGNIEAGLAAYRDHGNVIATTTREEAARELVARYDVARELGKDAALMAYRNADVKLLNDLARDGARARGELVGPDVLMQTDFGERAFARGERVVVRQTILVDGGGRWTNGQTAIVRGIDGTTLALQRERDGAQLGVDLTEHDRIDHAYAATKHREQGTTHELAFTLAARPDDARSTLVAMTRHVEDAVLAYAREDIPDFATLVARAARFDEKEMTTDYRLIREPMLEHTLDPVRDGQERGPTWTMEREQEIGQHEREIEHEPREIEREYVQEVEHGRDFGIDF
ncbi:MAG: AAA family ATPase, partial [Candidatus Eremiobacteraeota bacterium]|nr:AAA family ATPase [Candidatus Eremiobacteraeota bacterium]